MNDYIMNIYPLVSFRTRKFERLAHIYTLPTLETISKDQHTTKTVYGRDLHVASLTDTVASLETKQKVKHSVRKSIPNKAMLL